MRSGPIKWHGGKSYLAPKIRALFPRHTRYVEPFFGGGAVMLAGDGEGVAEWANDLNRDLINFWAVLADVNDFSEFRRIIEATPFCSCEFARAATEWWPTESRAERAARFFIRARQSRQGLQRDFATPTSRLRRGMNEQVSAWLAAVDGLPEFHNRLRRVEIRCQTACSLIQELDLPETLYYCDPPYMHETRVTTKEYGEHEMGVAEHTGLLGILSAIKGKFVLSGYRSSLYDDLAERCKWHRVDFEIPNQASSKKVKEIKTECVWCNFKPEAT